MTDIVFNVTILDLSSVSKFSTFIDDSKLLYRFPGTAQQVFEWGG